jgi:hypothetical protein
MSEHRTRLVLFDKLKLLKFAAKVLQAGFASPSNQDCG